MNKKSLRAFIPAIFLLATLMTSSACSDDGKALDEAKQEITVVHTEPPETTDHHQHQHEDQTQKHAQDQGTGVIAQDITGLYKELSSPQATKTGDKIEVIEVFWYGCPHCYQFEPTINKWLKEKAGYIEFVRIPGVLGPQWVVHARAYYAAENLGVLEKIHEPLFNAIHNEKRKIIDEKSLKSFFAEHGVTGNDFDKAYQSQEVEEKVRTAFSAGKNYELTGVPAIVINGKYTTSASMAGSFEKVVDVINTLSAKEYESLKQ
ncbi:MAG: thiol:disulfide interchange protein DsbA [Gammaproteobacteria bacterium]|jgi:thiol:disulfide interchange protein DsbA